jgi:small subunit ribosomal protein S7
MRHKKVEKRQIEEDKVYRSKLVAKFTNILMKDGKKSIAQKVVYKTFDLIAKKNQDPIGVFERALQNVGPRQEVRPRRIGGASYQVPVEVRGERKTLLAIRWILDAAKARTTKEFPTFAQKLAAELTDAANEQGAAIKKRDTVLRMAEANRAFAHFRF